MSFFWLLVTLAFSLLSVGTMVTLRWYQGVQPKGAVTVSAILASLVGTSYYIWSITFAPTLSKPSATTIGNGLYLATIILTVNTVLQLIIWLIYENIVRRRNVKLPKFFFDMIGMVILVTVFLVLFRRISGEELSGLLFTSTVASAIIGLALQDTLGNLISGISLQFEAPFAIDDWVEIGGHEGLLVSQNWRTLTLLTRENHRVLLTNRYVANDKIINYSRPTRRQIHNIFIAIEYQHPPEQVKKILIEVMEDLKEVDPDPYMPAFVHQYADFAIEYGLRYWIEDYGAVVHIQDVVLSRLWYVLKREGINFAYPTYDLNLRQVPANSAQVQRGQNVDHIFSKIATYSWLAEVLSDDQMKQLADNSFLRLYTKNETIVRQGDPGDSMFIVLRGEVQVYVLGKNGRRVRAQSIGEGDFFGEMSLLTGQPRSAFIYAEDDVEVIEINQMAFSNILVKDPQILELFLNGLEQKRSNLIEILEADSAVPIKVVGDRKNFLIERISKYLGILG